MTIGLAKWGNSMAVRIPKVILEELSIGEEDLDKTKFDVSVEKGKLILSKKQQLTKFEVLAKKAQAKTLDPVEIIDWGEPEGKEIW